MLISQWEIRSTIRREKGIILKAAADALVSELPSDLHHAILLAQEKGASSWLTSLLIHEHGFALHKGAFHDAMALCYSWIPKDFPVECTCGKHFTVEHALSCNRGGFPTYAITRSGILLLLCSPRFVPTLPRNQHCRN